ncbi:MAG: undecaprenyl-phosphate glucose phosphotransferase [Anaerolineae bacterium]|nr:undecaprenyl-phosphate glucose phosphotransferase [Anaerolineae bacterium]
MKRRADAVFGLALLLNDLVMVGLAFYVAYWLRQTIPVPPPVNIGSFGDYVGMLFIQMLTMTTLYFFSRLYDVKRSMPRLDEFYRIFAATSIGTVMTIAFTTFLFKNSALELDFPRVMVIYAWLLTVVLVTLSRSFLVLARNLLRRRGAWTDRLLIVGTGDVGRMILQKVRQMPRLGYSVVGFVDGDASAGEEIMGVPVLGGVDDIPAIIKDHEVEEVIIGLPELSHHEVLAIISRCERGQVGIKIFPDLFQIIATELSIGDLGGLPLLTVRDVALRGWKLTLKRYVDIVGSAVGLVILSPFLMLVSLAIKLDSPGPVLYAQERMGLDAKPFWCLKFRSMRIDAERNGPGWTTEDDPRVTRLGKFIRRFSIDELPQLINVLVGDMSLVGPRPERPVYVEQFRRSIPRYMDRHREKAGMTGWAQVNGLRGDTSIAERTKYDVWYTENWSLWLDFKIILRTIFAVFSDRHAY